MNSYLGNVSCRNLVTTCITSEHACSNCYGHFPFQPTNNSMMIIPIPTAANSTTATPTSSNSPTRSASSRGRRATRGLASPTMCFRYEESRVWPCNNFYSCWRKLGFDHRVQNIFWSLAMNNSLTNPGFNATLTKPSRYATRHDNDRTSQIISQQ